MPRPVTLFTGQWADLPLETVAKKAKSFGFDGLELACWGDHLDVVKAGRDKKYLESRHEILRANGLVCHAISNHLVGQAVCDPIDARHKPILPKRVWSDGNREGVRKRAALEMIATAKAAAKLGVSVVNGFTGSSVWHKLYFFPPTSVAEVHAGFDDFAKRWGPIFDAYQKLGVKFALEVHPTEIAYDIHTAERALAAVGHHPAFGFNFDPSHLLWQGIGHAAFLVDNEDRIFHVHMKDVSTNINGVNGVLGSPPPFGDHRRLGVPIRRPRRRELRCHRACPQPHRLEPSERRVGGRRYGPGRSRRIVRVRAASISPPRPRPSTRRSRRINRSSRHMILGEEQTGSSLASSDGPQAQVLPAGREVHRRDATRTETRSRSLRPGPRPLPRPADFAREWTRACGTVVWNSTRRRLARSLHRPHPPRRQDHPHRPGPLQPHRRRHRPRHARRPPHRPPARARARSPADRCRPALAPAL